MSVAVLFPGQGSQRPGMLRDLSADQRAGPSYREARDVLATLAGVPEELDTETALRRSTNAQLALLIAGVVGARDLIDRHELQVGAVAGHSIGAFGAAVLAGVLSLGDALRVVQVRGEEMERACASGEWGMAALRGLSPPAAQTLVDTCATDRDPLWVACINAADEIVISGTRAALRALDEHAARAGARELTPLDVTVASHCPIQATTAQAVTRALAGVPRGVQQIPYFANITGRRVLRGADQVVDDLARGAVHPVRWWDIARLMPEVGITATLQVPPGHVLTGIAQRETPQLINVAVDEIGARAAARRATG